MRCLGRPVCQVYAKPGFEFTRLLNAKDYVEMAANPEYV